MAGCSDGYYISNLIQKVALTSGFGHLECLAEVPTLMEPMVCGDGCGMRAMVVRKALACSTSSSLFLIRSDRSAMQFSDPQAGNASNKGCLFKKLV